MDAVKGAECGVRNNAAADPRQLVDQPPEPAEEPVVLHQPGTQAEAGAGLQSGTVEATLGGNVASPMQSSRQARRCQHQAFTVKGSP